MLRRRFAVNLLANYDDPRDGPVGPGRALRRDWNRKIPQNCPYRLEDVAVFDLNADREPREGIWPAGVARVLHERPGEHHWLRLQFCGHACYSLAKRGWCLPASRSNDLG